jgi:hypothetical protein
VKLRSNVVVLVVCAFGSFLAFSSSKTHSVLTNHAATHVQATFADGGAPPPPWPGCGCFADDAAATQPSNGNATVADGGAPPPPWPGCGCFAPESGTPESLLSIGRSAEVADGEAPPPPWPGCGCFAAGDETSPSLRARGVA